MFRHRLRLIIAGLLVSVFLAGPVLAATDAEIQAILADRIDYAKRSVGIVVGLIGADGETVVGHGRRGPDDPAIPDGDTVFEIGSVTKVFTATLLAEMAGRNKVAIEAPAASYLPDSLRFPGKEDDPITLYHLTTHTSGLPRMPDNFAPTDPFNPYADYSVQLMYEFLSGHEPARAPGETAEYSNLGVGLLGHILAEVAGTDYETLVKKRITKPLKMADTAITLTVGMKERLAVGHGANMKPTSNWDIPTLAGAGALRSTVDDMLKFVAANLGLTRTKLSAAFETTHRPRESLGDDGTQVGLGWIVTTEHGRAITWHNGGTGGYRSFVGLDKERRKGVVVLSNSVASIDDIGFHLLDPKFELADVKPIETTSDFPASPAGKALGAWLEVTRGSDTDAARKHYDEAFAESFHAAVPADAYMGFRADLQGMLAAADLDRVVARSDYDLSAYVNSNGVWLAIHIQVRPEEPHKIVGLLVQPTDPPEDAEPDGEE